MPQWQLVTQSQDTSMSSTTPVSTEQNISSLQPSPTNGHVDVSEPKAVPLESESPKDTAVDEISRKRVADPSLSSAMANGGCTSENENVGNGVKDSSAKGSEKKRESKKRSHNSKN